MSASRYAALLALGLAAVTPAAAQAPPKQRRAGAVAPIPARRALVKVDHPGHPLFERSCAPCHGAGPGDDGTAMLPGTMALERKDRGQVPAALELREGPGPEVILTISRQGSGAMPPFRKAELGDAEVESIAAYLAASARANPAGEEE